MSKKKIGNNWYLFYVLGIVVTGLIWLNQPGSLEKIAGITQKNNNTAVKGTQIIPTPLPTGKWIDVTTPTPTKANPVPQPTKLTNKIDCVGPDGKHFQATQKACDDFNNAWGKGNNNVVVNPTQNGKTLTEEQIKLLIQTQQSISDSNNSIAKSKLSQYDSCLKSTGFTKTSCNSTCYNKWDYENNACFASYSGAYPLIENNSSLLDACTNQASSNSSACDNSCNTIYTAAMDKCRNDYLK